MKIGVLICEDLWFPQPLKQCCQAGAQLIVALNASPFDHNKAQTRETILVERAHEARAPIIYVNLIGGQDELVFDGGSMVIDQNGHRCAQAAYFSEELMPIDIDIAADHSLAVQRQELPPALSEEENIYQALVLGVRDYVHKNHFPGAIIGLSGGIDSSLTLAITVDALGPEQVTAIMMPSRYTSEISKEDAQQQARELGRALSHHGH